MDLRKRHNPLLSQTNDDDLQKNSVADSVTKLRKETSQSKTSRYIFVGFSCLLLSLITTLFYPKTLDQLFGGNFIDTQGYHQKIR